MLLSFRRVGEERVKIATPASRGYRLRTTDALTAFLRIACSTTDPIVSALKNDNDNEGQNICLEIINQPLGVALTIQLALLA